MSATRPQVYSGSRLCQPLSVFSGLPIDQVNFVVSQIIGLLLGFLYRKLLPTNSTSGVVRHLAGLIPGVVLGYFCFGHQVYNLLVLTTLSYISILTCSPKVVQRVVLFIALMHLSYLHLLRLFHDYGGYTIDITGPIMIAVQKVTNVGFSLHDGLGRSEKELTDEQKKYAIRKRPTFLEFYSYVFQFHSLLSGPLVFYNDYVEFIDGTNFSRHIEQKNQKTKNPSPLSAVLKKVATSITFAVVLITISPKFPISYLKDDKFLYETPFLSKIIYLIITCWVARFKYYHAWIIGESICNAAGLGFAGFKDDGEPDWGLMSNIDIWRFENAPNLRVSLEAWNKTTQAWLRRTAYERNKRHRLLLTYVLSAMWHGFYPGYYLTFLGGAFFTMATRNVRRCLRPHFQSTRELRFVYDVLTYITTRVIMAYLVFPFILLEFQSAFTVFAQLYFFGHILGLIAIFVVPVVFPPPKVVKTKDS